MPLAFGNSAMIPEIEFHPFRDETRISATAVSGSTASRTIVPMSWQRNRQVCLLDSPSGYVDVEEPLWWSCDVDSTSPVSPPVSGKTRDECTWLLSTADQMELVVYYFGFNKRQFAEVFGVSRQAIYDWLKGENVSEANAERISWLARLVAKACTGLERPLNRRFTTQSAGDGECSLLDLLRADSWDETRILQHLRRARNLTVLQATHRRTLRVETPIEQSDDVLLDNLLSLGEE